MSQRADRKYTYRVEVDSSSLAAAEAEIRKRLGGAMADIQSQPEAQRATGTTLAEFQKLEAELKRIGAIDLSAPVDKMAASLQELRANIRQIDAELQGAHVRGGPTGDARYRAQVEDYYTALAQAQGDDAARLARGRGVVGNIGQVYAQFADDQRPVDEFTQSAYAQVEEVRQHSREQTRQLMESEAKLYATQQAAAQAEMAINQQRIAQLESQLADDDDGRILQAYAEAADEQERLAAAEVDAAQSLAQVKRRLREEMEQDAAAARKAALQSGDLSAAGGGGTSNLNIGIRKTSVDNAERLVPLLERATKLQEGYTEQIQRQVQLEGKRNDNELESIKRRHQAAQDAERLLEAERTAGAAARAEVQKTIAAHAEAEKRITVEARAEANERAAIARRESATKIEEAREARIRATEEERRQTAAYRAELSQRQRAATQSRGGGIAGGGFGLAGVSTLVKGGLAAAGLYGAREIVLATDQFAQLGAVSERSALAFELLSGSAENAEAKLNAVQRASGGAIDKLTAMQIANKAGALQMAETASELERVTKFATIVSRVLGTDTSGALDQMALAAANLSFRRLDELGVNAAKARDRFNELKGTMDDSRAFLQAMLEVGEATFAGMEDSALGASTGMEQLKAQLTDIKNILAEMTNDALDGPAGLIARALGADAPQSELQQRIDDAIQRLEEDAFLPDVGPRYNLLLEVADAIEAAKGKDGELQRQLLETGAMITYMPGPPAEEFVAKVQAMIQAARDLTSAAEAAGTAVASIGGTFGGTLSNIGGIFTGGWKMLDQSTPGVSRWSQTAIDSRNEQQRARADAAKERAEVLTDIRDRFLDAVDAQEKEYARAAERTAKAWESAAKEAESAFRSAVSGIPGIGSPSTVTEQDMELAKYGLYQEKPDEYLRQVEDELRNGRDYAHINRGDIERMVAQSGGFDQGALGAIPNELLADLFREEWSSKRLFADPANLDLMGMDAAKAALAQQQAGQRGENNLFDFLGASDLALPYGIGQEFGPKITEEMAGGIRSAWPEAIAGVDFAGPLGTAVASQGSSPGFSMVWQNFGAMGARQAFSGYENELGSLNFFTPLADKLYADVMSRIISALDGNNP